MIISSDAHPFTHSYVGLQIGIANVCICVQTTPTELQQGKHCKPQQTGTKDTATHAKLGL